MARSPREIAFRILLDSEKDTSRHIDDIFKEFVSKEQIKQLDKNWTMELVYGSVRLKLFLDELIQSTFKGNYRKAQHALKVLLRMGTYQLRCMQVPDYAAISESVALARRVGQAGSASLINAILRKIQNLDVEGAVLAKLDTTKRTSVEFSHPEWLIKRWVQHYDLSSIQAMCNYNNRTPNTWIRRNKLQVNQEMFESYLHEHSVNYTRSEVLERFYKINSAANILDSNEFHEGWFSFQDIAAGMVASLITPKRGETLVDACSAPGGKLSLIAESYAGILGHIYALDASPSRLELTKQTLSRLKIEGISIDQADASSDSLPLADWILIDVPCSGTGVLNRRPDARWNKLESDIDALQKIQSNILKNAWKHLQPGGRMIYATCSIEPEENWEIIESVLPDLEHGELEPIVNQKMQAYVDDKGALSTLPWRDKMDGMFAIVIRKV